MEELEVNLEEIKIALAEMGIEISIEELEAMDKEFLLILQAKLFDIKKIKKEMEFLIQNNEILRSLIETYKEKISILGSEKKKSKSKSKAKKEEEIEK